MPLRRVSILAAVNLSSLSPSMVGGGCLLVFCGLLTRGLATFVCTQTTDWNWHEKLFTCITWCPKATVQAALSTVALDYVTDSANRKEFDDDGGDADFKTSKERGTVLLTVAVLSIILTAPAFAVAMKYAGENWLVKETNWVNGKRVEPTDTSQAMDDFDAEAPVTIDLRIGTRKDSLSGTLGNRKISMDIGVGGRSMSISKQEVTPRGVAPKDIRKMSNPATLRSMGLASTNPITGRA